MLQYQKIHSYSINSPHEIDGLKWNIELLTNAIVWQAATDYKWLWAGLQAGDSTKNEIENFFMSEWFKTLTDVRGDKIMYATKMQGLTESLFIRIEYYLEERAKTLRLRGKHMNKKSRSAAFLNIAGMLKSRNKTILKPTKEFSEGFQAGIETAFDVINTLMRENDIERQNISSGQTIIKNV